MSHTSQPYNTPQTICLYNAKGGTGKTTVGINVAGALNQRDHDVLFVDLDPQGNATEGLGLVEAYDAGSPNLFDIVTGKADPSELTDLIQAHEEMDVVPSNVDMLRAERQLVIDDYEGRNNLPALRDAIQALGSRYDYVLIDSPPFFGELSDSALFAAQNILIPSLTESTSQRAVELLFDQVALLEVDRDIFVNEVAAVANRVESTNEADRMQQWLQEVFPDVPVFTVRKRVALQRAHRAGVSIFEHNEQSDMADVFLDVAGAIEDELGAEP